MFLPVLAAPSTKGATPLLLRLAASLLMLVTGQASAMDMRSAPKLGAMEATRCVTPAAQYHSVNPWVLRAILKVESGFNPGAINRNPNNTVDVGIAQMNSMHFKELQQHGVAPGHLLDGCIATYVAAWHLAKQMRVHGNTWFGIAAYHSATPCFNARYAGLLWNALLEMGAIAGDRIRVKSLEQCGFVGVNAKAKDRKGIASPGAASVTYDVN